MKTFVRPFPLTVLLAIVFKLWLTANIRTVPILAPHDASNFLEHAKKLMVGHWFGGYTDLTLIKGPFLPIYLTIVHDFGLPLISAHVLLDAGACLVVCFALRPIVARPGVLAALFLFLFFNPFTYNSDAWLTMRSQVNPDLAMMCVACAMGMLLRRRQAWGSIVPWAVGLGASFSAFWLTREEAVWLVPALIVVLLPYVVASIRRRSRASWPRLALVAIPIVMWFAAINIIATINGAVYGWRTVTEIQAPEFESAYSSLERLDPGHVDLNVAVSKLGLQRAYAVSANARALMPQIEGGVGNNWRLESCRGVHICDEIGAPLFGYALRDAVAFTGNASTGAQAREFYAKMASQIDYACDQHVVPCARKRGTFLPAALGQHLDAALNNFAQGLQAIVTLAPLNMSRPPYTPPSTNLRADYENVVRSVHILPGASYIGWLIHKPARSIAIEDPSPTDLNSITFHPSADVAKAFGSTAVSQGYETANIRFEIFTSCSVSCSIDVTTLDGQVLRIPLSPQTVDFHSPTAIYHVDSVATTNEDDFDGSLRNVLINEIARAYRSALPVLLLATATLLLLRLLRAGRGIPVAEHVFLALGVSLSVGALVAILAIIALFGVGAFNSEYMGAIFSLTFLVTGVIISAEGIGYYRRIRRALSRRWSASPFTDPTTTP